MKGFKSAVIDEEGKKAGYPYPVNESSGTDKTGAQGNVAEKEKV